MKPLTTASIIYTQRLVFISDDENQQSCTSSPIREMSPETEKLFNILSNELLEDPFVEPCPGNPLQGIGSIKDSSPNFYKQYPFRTIDLNEKKIYVEASDSNDEETVSPFKPKDVNFISGSKCTVVQCNDNSEGRQETYVEASDDEELGSCLQPDCMHEVRNLKDRETPIILKSNNEETEVNKLPTYVTQIASGEDFQNPISEGKVIIIINYYVCGLLT